MVVCIIWGFVKGSMGSAFITLTCYSLIATGPISTMHNIVFEKRTLQVVHACHVLQKVYQIIDNKMPLIGNSM